MGSLFWFIIGLVWIGVIGWLRQPRHSARMQRVAVDLIAGGILFLLTIAFFWRTLSGDVYQPADGGDLVSLLFPTYRFAASQLTQGILPLWNPHLRGGAPFINDIQAGFLYLPNLLLFWLNPQFEYKWMQWLSIGHLYWAGLGMYVLLRSLRGETRRQGNRATGEAGESLVAAQGSPITNHVSRITPHPSPLTILSAPAALFGAVAFQFSDALFIHLGNLNLIAVLSWLPWVLTAFQRALTEKSLRWAALAGMLFALGNYAGHAQSSLYVGLALIVYFGFWILDFGFHTKASAIRNLQYPLLTFTLALLLTAPILLPAIEMTAYTERANFTYQDAIAYSLDPVQALSGMLSPGFFGRGPSLHWSLWDRVETPYAGVATLLLALAALLLTDRATRRLLLPWLGMAVIGLLIALGVYGIVHGILYWILPGFAQFRGPARAIILWAMGVAVVAAVGVDGVLRKWGSGEKGRAGGGEKGRAGGGEKGRMGSGEVGENLSTQYATRNTQFFYFQFLKVGGLFLLLILTPLVYATLLVTQSDPVVFLRVSLAGLAVLIATLLWLATWAVVMAYRSGWLSSTITGAVLITLLFLDFTSTGAYTDISSSDPTRGFQHSEVIDFLRADSDLFRIDSRTSPDPRLDCVWQPNTAALVGLQDVCSDPNPLTLIAWKQLWESTGGRDTQRYDMLNVKYVIVKDGTPLPGDDKFELVLDAADDLSIYRNRRAWPRGWITTNITASLPVAGLADVNFTHYGANEMTVQVVAAQAATLVLSELWFPGWQATVNGERAEVKRSDMGLRLIDVPVGKAEVHLWFSPQSWRYGWIAAGIGVILLLVVLVLSRKEQR